MTEISQLEWEARQLAASQARDALFRAVTKQPALLALWRAWREAEAALIDGGRARRESELTDPTATPVPVADDEEQAR